MKKYNIQQSSTPPAERISTAEIITSCTDQLKKCGSVILVPTETVYGLVCDWQDQTAIERIYNLKQRDYGKPLALFADSLQTLKKHGIVIPEKASKLAKKFCPGPITIVVADAKGKTTGFRIPDHPFMLELLRQYGRPLASTSANCSGMPNALSVGEAADMLAGKPDIVIDNGSLPQDASASTVVLIDKTKVEILRSGQISAEAINSAL